MQLAPGGFLAWIIVGLIAGWLTGKVMRGSGYGCLADIVVGLIGALIGGFLVGFLVRGTAGFFGSILVATFGAIVFVAVVRAIAGRGSTL